MSKPCTKCQGPGPFYKSSRGGLRSECAACANARTKASRQGKEARQREYALRYRYGIGLDLFAEMLANQLGRCLICRNEMTKRSDLNVDHCHETGKVRGILCRRCNQGLGHFRDNIESLKRASVYLETHLTQITESNDDE